MNWRRDGLVLWKPVRALLFADKKVFFWIKGKLGLSDYQMAALVWLMGVILGLLLRWWVISLETSSQAWLHRLNPCGVVLFF